MKMAELLLVEVYPSTLTMYVCDIHFDFIHVKSMLVYVHIHNYTTNQ